MSKDQAIGGAILAVCVIVAIGYAVVVLFPAQISSVLGMTVDSSTGTNIRLLAVLIPVFIAFVAILMIGAWIGWTMATTPPPKPIEEITTEMEEKKEETPAAEQPAAPASATPAPEKKKKN